MSDAALFTPFQVDHLQLPNRIVVAPMAQYSAVDGEMQDWHLMHLGQLACSGAGLLTIEATAVTAEGRNTYGDVGLYSDACERAMMRVLGAIRQWASMPIGLQLNHAGRKSSRHTSWDGGAQVPPGEPNGWQTRAPSPIPFAERDTTPLMLDRDALADLRGAFAQAARRAARLELDLVEILGGHGYLLHEFLSPLSNRRDDEFGGSLENRMRFPLQVFDAVRDAFGGPVSMRVSATDWVAGGWSLEETIAFVSELEARGCAGVSVSSGGTSPSAAIPVGPSYQVPFAREIKRTTAMPVIAAGLITDFDQAEAIVRNGDADLVALARALLFDPRWPWRAAAHFGARVSAPKPYLRAVPRRLGALFQ